MLKITIDGNSIDGWDARVDLPAKPDELAGDTHLYVVQYTADLSEPERVESLGDVLPRFRQDILNTEGLDIFTEEIVVIHEDSDSLLKRMITEAEELVTGNKEAEE